jgi:hypothetical protein
MRLLHRTAAVVLGIAALVVIGLLINAALSGDHLEVVNFVLYAIGAGLAITLGLFLWREPGR